MHGIFGWTMVVTNGVIALSYATLTVQLCGLARSSELLAMLGSVKKKSDERKISLFMMIVAMAALFASFIALCGLSHALEMVLQYLPGNQGVQIAMVTVMILCALVSLATAVAGSQLFGLILTVLSKYELNSEGNLQHVENYLIEVVELVKESVIVLSEDLQVMRCNEASMALFHCTTLVRERVIKFIHPEDLMVFKEAVREALLTDTHTPVTVEYRVCVPKVGRVQVTETPSPVLTRAKRAPSLRNLRSVSWGGSGEGSGRGSTSKVFPTAGSCEDSSAEAAFTPAESRRPSVSASADFSAASSPTHAGQAAESPQYAWVESTICKGMRLNGGEGQEYDLKMISRNIDGRKKEAQAQYQNILRASEEQARINAAKLRYISCIAHDLKTPLQSFCFSLDLLQQTALQEEQRDLVQQANVAVDLMKLTISQTMDISKALSGGKLQPRRTTLFLSTVIARVQIIINGYGKQVPITFEVAPDVCDAVITDEEWLWQMLLNLLTNACKYTDKGSIHVSVTATSDMALPVLGGDSSVMGTASTGPTRSLLFEVIDTGVGVSRRKLGTLFDAFSQVQEGQVTGTGLGLFGVRTRAEGLQGTCGARRNAASSTGTGTVIWFAIPYVPDHHSKALSISPKAAVAQSVSTTALSVALALSLNAKPAGNRSGTAAASPHGGLSLRQSFTGQFCEHGLTAMVVDDTLTVRKLMERLLLKMGFARVDCYENGSKGLDAMMAGQVDIVFSDVQMPIMTGPEMVSRFREWEETALETGERDKKQLIVAVTANGSQLAEAGASQGFDMICFKPLGAQDIQRVVQDHFC